MKVLVVLLVLSSCVWWSSSAEEDCTIPLFPSFKLHYGQPFAIPEGCLKFTCKGGNLYELSTICPDLYRGYPTDKYNEKIEARGKQILNGEACLSN